MLLWLSILVPLGGLILTALLNALTAPMLRRPRSLDGLPSRAVCPRVSLLVPARNEEANIQDCLAGLTAQQYADLEILVLDDHSEDDTARIIQAICLRDPRVRYLSGQPLPSGWTGKNWACHQLGQEASGDILIFTDADNRHAPEATANTVAWMQHLGLGLLSAFPQQTTVSLAERLVIPVIDLFVYAMLPLWLTYYSRNPAFAAANGQWIAFTRSAYERTGGHKAVGDKVVEDVELSRLAKRQGIRILTTAGTNVVSGRMYHSGSEVWQGFSKNLFGLTGNRTGTFFGLVGTLSLICIFPYPLLLIPTYTDLAGIAIVLNLALRLILALKYRHPLLTSLVLHPVGIGFTILIALNSYIQVKRGHITWKGREIPVKKSPCHRAHSDRDPS